MQSQRQGWRMAWSTKNNYTLEHTHTLRSKKNVRQTIFVVFATYLRCCRLLFGKRLFTSFIHVMQPGRSLHSRPSACYLFSFALFILFGLLQFKRKRRRRQKKNGECKSNSFIMHFCSFGAFGFILSEVFFRVCVFVCSSCFRLVIRPRTFSSQKCALTISKNQIEQ